MASLDEKTLLRAWTRAIGTLDELALKRIRRVFPLLYRSVVGMPKFNRLYRTSSST
jgi:hypothetical protein